MKQLFVKNNLRLQKLEMWDGTNLFFHAYNKPKIDSVCFVERAAFDKAIEQRNEYIRSNWEHLPDGEKQANAEIKLRDEEILYEQKTR